MPLGTHERVKDSQPREEVSLRHLPVGDVVLVLFAGEVAFSVESGQVLICRFSRCKSMGTSLTAKQAPEDCFSRGGLADQTLAGRAQLSSCSQIKRGRCLTSE